MPKKYFAERAAGGYAEEVALPSGRSVMVMRVTEREVIDLARERPDECPNWLAHKKNGAALIEQVNMVVAAALGESQIGDQSNNEHLALADLTLQDKMAILDSAIPRGLERKRKVLLLEDERE
jgi:hypothetical protein